MGPWQGASVLTGNHRRCQSSLQLTRGRRSTPPATPWSRPLALVFRAKGRPLHHPLIAHVEDEGRARALAASWPEAAARLARAFWPGPLTVVVERAGHVPAAIAGGASSIALRVPSHPVAL